MSKPTKQKLRNIHPGEVLREEFLLSRNTDWQRRLV
jgi:plasmid maintenance system antidote protein VapI